MVRFRGQRPLHYGVGTRTVVLSPIEPADPGSVHDFGENGEVVIPNR